MLLAGAGMTTYAMIRLLTNSVNECTKDVIMIKIIIALAATIILFTSVVFAGDKIQLSYNNGGYHNGNHYNNYRNGNNRYYNNKRNYRYRYHYHGRWYYR